MTTSIFSPESLQKLVDESLPKDAGPNDHVVVGTLDETGAQVVAGFTFHESKATWELQAAARHDWGGNNEVGAKVLLRW